jgi:hypothetical protein
VRVCVCVPSFLFRSAPGLPVPDRALSFECNDLDGLCGR